MPSTYRKLFQVAYVTTDLAAALDAFHDQQGVADFLDLGQVSLDVADGAVVEIKIALGYVDDVLIEIVEPVGGAVDLYRRHLATDGFDLRLHHLGYLADSGAELDAIAEEHLRSGHPIALKGSFGSLARFFYADTETTLGHYQEYVFFDAGGQELLTSIPRN